MLITSESIWFIGSPQEILEQIKRLTLKYNYVEEVLELYSYLS